MYKSVKFRTRPKDELLEEIDWAGETYGDLIRTIFLPDGNTLVLKTEKLLPILNRIKEKFPKLERITCYGSARYAIKKTAEEFKRLKEAGLTRIHMGIESGDAKTLENIKKGATREEIIDAGVRVKKAGIEISEYILVGIAGPERSIIHAKESARVLNAIEPTFVRFRTYVPVPGTPLGDEYASGQFTLLSAHQCLKEIRTVVDNLKGSMILCSDHVSNYADISGKLPDDKNSILKKLDHCLSLDEEAFRGDLMGFQL